MISKFTKFFVIATLVAMFAMPLMASALDTGLNEVGQKIELGQEDLRTTVGSIINVALSFLGVVAIIIVLIGGFKYMTAGGSDEKVQEARKWIISGIIGLAIILSAYAITAFVINQLVSATTE
jgi:hypothetical protein